MSWAECGCCLEHYMRDFMFACRWSKSCQSWLQTVVTELYCSATVRDDDDADADDGVDDGAVDDDGNDGNDVDDIR